MRRSASRSLHLLYLTAVDPQGGDNIISSPSRITIGTLCRDFTVSLAVAGSITTVGMNRLRVDLGPVRVAGGFERSGADRRASPGLRPFLRERFGGDLVNARLQTAIQRKVADFDAVVVDDIAAWAYRPAQPDGKVAYIAREVVSGTAPEEPSWFARWRGPSLRDAELAVLQSVDYVFARPEVAAALSEIGVPLRLLQGNYSRPASGSPTFNDANFSLTSDRIGYIGYLGFQQNLASLEWFLSSVWPLIKARRRKVELHVIGSAPEAALQQRLNALSDVHLHWNAGDRKLLDLGCRVVVDPLLYENHVDAKLVNSMARSLPVITTASAANRAHSDIGECVAAAGSPEEMASMIDTLMSQPAQWKALSDRARTRAAALLPDFEVAHALRRVLGKLHQETRHEQ